MKRAIIFAVATLIAGYAADAATASAAFKVGSKIAEIHIVATAKLPTNPHRTRVGEDCSAFAIQRPKSLGGMEAAKKGWIVTSEAKLGTYDAVTFVSELDPAYVSGTCVHKEGNMAIFAGSRVRAIAYLRPPPPRPVDPSLGVDEAADDSLGYAEQISAGRIRLSHGLPSTPIADVVLRNGIFIEPVIKKDRVCGGAAWVPNIFGEDIQRARSKLRQFGWLPIRSSEESGGEELRKKGIVEAGSCSGTGYGFCGFNYRHKGGFTLFIGTADDPPEVLSYEVGCGSTGPHRSGR